MQIEKRLKNHYRRWNIEFNYEKEFEKFKNRLIEVLKQIIGDYLSKNLDIDRQFTEFLKRHKAEKPDVRKSQMIPKTPRLTKDMIEFVYTETEPGFGDTSVYKCLDTCETLQELATATQILFWSLEQKNDETRQMVSEIIKEIRKISILTPSASFAIHKRGKQVTIYPPGDPFLDREIIDCSLSGLEHYPEVAKHFEKALEIHQSGDKSKYRNLLDNLRFSLEQLLKKVFNNQKSLENQKNNFLPWLKKKGLHKQVVNLYEKLLSSYQDYQNNAVKHNEEFSLSEVELMIYLTGIFMRLILQLERGSDYLR